MKQTEPPAIDESLQHSPLFAGVDARQRERMLADMTRMQWPGHSPALGDADTTERFYLIESGRVKISQASADSGRELSLELLGPGDGFSLVSLLDGQPHAVMRETLEPVSTLSAPLAAWHTWLESQPALRRALLRYVAARLRVLEAFATDLALADTQTRLARLLLSQLAGEATRRPALLHGLPQEELAHLIGSVRVVVTRTLQRFRREGLVRHEAGRWIIEDIRRLAERAGVIHASHHDKS
ncbi:Crp/Fnr family transcriptional regulator [Acidihalobacter prosperus]|uniref:Crp/Fnr family transcriptional regulator n=1 Tax=Acidihalobacter prosperus TaxID=160660 RepID=A0A1A6C3Q6_9GAMM|nr:Crp/Fnr family transcriptional regulator [Acidihalobacter prosperus]OBS09197.1 hypothetical protein Thpro_021525 [Acidihalobacter prosperus]